ncbi:MAG: large repetitive protein, partial [Acetobacteraceae bacterium]|nr:large repetitive protein [Acetobacteraceae bacterium]
MTIDTWAGTASSNWSNGANWTPSAPVTGDQVNIGNAKQAGAVAVTEDVTLTLAALVMAGNSAQNSTTLLITQPAVLTVNGPILLGANSIITGAGTLVTNGAIIGTGKIIAGAGLLDISGTGGIGTGVVLGFDASATAASTLKLDLNGNATSSQNILMNSAAQTLEIGHFTSLTVKAKETISNATLRMSGGTFADAFGMTIGGGTVIGFGTLATNVIGVAGTSNQLTASGGTLDVIGSFSEATPGTFHIAIDSATSSTLKFDGNTVLGQAIAINSALQTLEIGALGSLTMTGLESITKGSIKMDGGTLTDTSGIVIGAGATLTGNGRITAGTAVSGSGVVKASGGTLELGNDLTSTAIAFDIDAVSGSVLRLDGAVASAETLTFLGNSGTLELADVSAGVVQGFNGKIAGLSVGPSATVPTNAINIQTAVTGAVLSGSTLTIVNGSTTVATLALSAAPISGAYAVVQANSALGGYDVFLSNEPPAGPGLGLDPSSDSGIAGDNVTNVIAPVITGTGVAGDTITLFQGGSPVGSATVDLSGTWSFTTTTLTEGLNAITATETDIYGNVSSAVALDLTIDTVAPVVATQLAFDTGSSATDLVTSNAALTGTAEANNTITISQDTIVLGTTTSDASGAWSFTPLGLTDGNYSLTASETDAAGNVGSTTLAFTLDTAGPVVPGTPGLSASSNSGLGTDNTTNVSTPMFTGTAEANATITLFDGLTAVGSGEADVNGRWVATTHVLSDGPHAINARATDLAGNVSVASAALTVTIDTSAPSVPSTPDLSTASDSGASSTDNVTKVTRPVFTGTAEAGAKVTLFDGANVVGTVQADSAGAWSVTTSVLANGVHAITAQASDLAGNIGLASAALSVTIDTTPPVVPHMTKVTISAISGSAEANSAISLFDGTAQIATGLTDAAGAWSTPLALTTGTHSLITRATDLAGNTTSSGALTAIIGTSGNDLFDTPGVVTMLGGTGDDTYTVNSSLDVVTENAGEGSDTVLANTSYTLAAGSEIEFLTANSTAVAVLTGNEFANTITDGVAGTGEKLSGGSGDDIYLVRNAGDIVIEAAGGGTDTVNTTLNSYSLSVNVENLTFNGVGAFTGIGNAGANILTGGAGANNLKAGAGDDTLFGGAGNDVLDGGAGADTMTGGAGNDTYFVDNIGDTVIEAAGGGTDTVNTSLNSYVLAANVEILN